MAGVGLSARAADISGAWATDVRACDKIFQKKGNVLTLTSRSDTLGGGFIIDGAIRDVSYIKTLPLPVYAAGVMPAGPYKEGPGEINVAVSCGGVTVHPGDILVGDEDGVVVISPSDALDVLQKARAKSKDEKKTIEEIDLDTWDRTWVDKALAAKGCQIID